MVPDVPYPPEITGDDALVEVVRSLRRYHDGAAVARPTRLWELAGVAWRWVPLLPDWEAGLAGFDTAPARRGERLRLLCDTYGLDTGERAAFLDVVERRLAAEAETAADDQREPLLRTSWFVTELRYGWEPYL